MRNRKRRGAIGVGKSERGRRGIYERRRESEGTGDGGEATRRGRERAVRRVISPPPAAKGMAVSPSPRAAPSSAPGTEAPNRLLFLERRPWPTSRPRRQIVPAVGSSSPPPLVSSSAVSGSRRGPPPGTTFDGRWSCCSERIRAQRLNQPHYRLKRMASYSPPANKYEDYRVLILATT